MASGVRPASRQAAWYFRHETVAAPRDGMPVAGFDPGVSTFDDLRRWAAGRAEAAPIDFPPLVWLAAPHMLHQARPTPGGLVVVSAQGSMPLRLVPRLALNRSFVDASSMAFFEGRALNLCGTVTAAGFVARALWPLDFKLGPTAPPPRAWQEAAPAAAHAAPTPR